MEKLRLLWIADTVARGLEKLEFSQPLSPPIYCYAVAGPLEKVLGLIGQLGQPNAGS